MISCIVATGKSRQRFLGQLLRCFASQTVRDAELVIVEDGRDSAPYWSMSGRVTHFHVAPMSMGAKLNLAARYACGNVLQKLDDDDFYAPRFLERTLESLADDDSTIVSWRNYPVLFLDDGMIRQCSAMAGGTICCKRSVWEKHPFRDASRSVDVGFWEDAGLLVQNPEGPEYMMVRHGANTWASVDPWYRQQPAYPATLQEILGRDEESLRFYSGGAVN